MLIAARKQREEETKGLKTKLPLLGTPHLPTSSKATPLSVVPTTSQKLTDEIRAHMMAYPPKGPSLPRWEPSLKW